MKSELQNTLPRESTRRFSLKKKYLDMHDLHFISSNHKDGNRGRILQAVANYHLFMDQTDKTITEKIEKMLETQALLQKYIEAAKDKAFGTKIIEKLQLDVYQKLQEFMPDATIAKRIHSLFETLIGTEKLGEFNLAVQKAIIQNKFTASAFDDFLDCVAEPNI